MKKQLNKQNLKKCKLILKKNNIISIYNKFQNLKF